MKLKRLLNVCLLTLSLSLAFGQMMVRAQEPTPEATAEADVITQSIISYGQVVQETLTEESFVDLWTFFGSAGDHVVARMTAVDGLAPLLGVTDAGGELIYRSDVDESGVQADAPVNGVSEIDFILPDTAEYTLVTTRVGNENGTTTGSYSLALTFVENSDVSGEDNTFQEVVFRCGADEIVTAASIELSAEPGDNPYQVTVYGLDGFTPYLRVDVVETGEMLACSNEVGTTTNQQIVLPDDGELTADQETVKAVQLALPDLSQSGVVRIIIGSVDGAAGRFYTVIEGAAIQPAGNFDRINLRPAPRARDESLLLYMLKNPRTRIDPQITYVMEDAQEADQVITCDDAGRFECETIQPAINYRFPLAGGEVVTGDALSAGISILSPDLQYAFAQLRNRSTTTTGAYTILLMGRLPALVIDDE